MVMIQGESKFYKCATIILQKNKSIALNFCLEKKPGCHGDRMCPCGNSA
jgi:hypothetical protein